MRELRSVVRAVVRAVVRLLCCVLALPIAQVEAQEWRESAAHMGSTARVLLIGTRPEDDDNALVAWLSLGRHVETAFLSITRGESGANVIGAEREFPLGAVRTAELLAARQRDRAHQYFTRAYDMGFTASDSVVDVAWPHDSLLKDVVSVVRAFRPHVIVVLTNSGERDASRRRTSRLAAEAYAAASDTVRWPPSSTSRLSAWSVARLFTRSDRNSDSAATTRLTEIDVGEFDRERGRSYAELGAEIRRLQRTQGAVAAPSTGRVLRRLRLDSARVESDASLFGSIDTSFTRFRGWPSTELSLQLDSLRRALDATRLAASGSADALAAHLARVARYASTARLELTCRDESAVPSCAGPAGDLAVSLTTIRERATRAMLGAAGLVIEGLVARQLVAAGDSAPVSVAIYNGGKSSVSIRRVAAFGPNRLSVIVRDTNVLLPPDSTSVWTTHVRMSTPTYYWWQINGLVDRTRIHDFRTTARMPVVSRLISGEDRIVSSGVEATVVIDGIEVPVIVQPLAYRSATTARGDHNRPLVGVLPASVLLDRSAEYERARSPIDRLFRVFVSSARATSDTVTVDLALPTGLRADSLRRAVVLPPFGARNLFYRVRGALPQGEHVIAATAVSAASQSVAPGPPYRSGTVMREYPHIPSQHFQRIAEDRIESVELRVPPTLRVAYVRGSEDLRESFTQLKLNVRPLEPLLLPVFDLRGFTTILIGAGALGGEAGAVMVPALQNFLRGGGTVVVLPGGEEVARSGLLPYEIGFGPFASRVSDPSATVRILDRTSQLLTWPNVIAAADFERWWGHRARGIPAAVDARYAGPLSIGEPGQAPITAALLEARVGKGRVIYTALALDTQLDAAHAGAARLLVNLMAAGMGQATR